MAKKASNPGEDSAEVEAPDDGGLVVFEFRDTTFTIPRDADEWTTLTELARIKAVSSGDINDWITFLQELLGAQWRLVLSVAPKRTDLYEFIGLISDTVRTECQV